MGPQTNFSLVARDMDCPINVANIHGIRVNAALLSGFQNNVSIGHFDGTIDQDQPSANEQMGDDEYLRKFREKYPEIPVSDNDNAAGGKMITFKLRYKKRRKSREIEITLPMEEFRNYNLNFDSQDGAICVDTEDQIDIGMVIGVLKTRLESVKPSSIKAKALFDILTRDRSMSGLR